ncbi:MAG: DUF5630 domain-containing protein [Legionella sp.]|uniref:DUF5630 domain-containing protein n=1 Tax=Legionella sp. TaxID=459 RepID=UPI002842F8EA|nr:DUF5630 domain-containing protein [Legionella sp.]
MKTSTKESRMATKLDFLIRNVKDAQPEAMKNLVNFFDSFEEPEELAFLLLHHTDLLHELMDSRYSDYWDNELSNCSPSNFKFKQPYFLTSIEFWVSYILGICYIEQHGFHTAIQFVLTVPPELIDYRILYSTNFEMKTNLSSERINEEQKEMLIDIFKKACPYHGTPGYLLLASLHAHLTVLVAKKADEEKDLTVRQELLNEKDKYSYDVLKYVRMAQIAESNSASEINNAFYGKSLSASLPFSAKSIPELYDVYKKCLDIADTPATKPIQKIITEVAMEEFIKTENFLKNRKAKINAHRQQQFSSYAQQEGRNHYLETPLLTTARMGDWLQIKELKASEHSVDWDAVDYLGNNVLHLAVLGECTSDVVDLLLKQSASLQQIKNYNGDAAPDLDENSVIKKPVEKSHPKKKLGLFKTEPKKEELNQEEKPSYGFDAES